MDLVGTAKALYDLAQLLWQFLTQLFMEAYNASNPIPFLALGVMILLAGRAANVIATAIGGALILVSVVALVKSFLGV